MPMRDEISERPGDVLIPSKPFSIAELSSAIGQATRVQDPAPLGVVEPGR